MAAYQPQSSDTGLEAERFLIERYRAMTPAEKMRIFSELCRTSQALALAGLRQRHPDAGAKELRLRLAATRLPAEVMREVFGWSVDASP